MSVHNRSELTRKCLVSLHSVAEHATEVELLVFMTDDGCTDDTVIEARAVWPDIEIIRGSGIGREVKVRFFKSRSNLELPDAWILERSRRLDLFSRYHQDDEIDVVP
jgi:hypothetical protein